MPISLNHDIAGQFDEVARLLAEQGANRFRVHAYERAAATLRQMSQPVADLFANEGLAGLEKLPNVGLSIARSIRDLLMHGRFGMLERLRGEHDPVTLLQSVPGIGPKLAWKLHEELNLESLADLETAAHDGRLSRFVGAKRLAGIRDSLAHRLNRLRDSSEAAQGADPSVTELLDVDREYRRGVAAGTIRKIAPRRFNPSRRAWLPVLHTIRGPRHYTALFSNTARAHRLGKTNDWVVIAFDGASGERQSTVITAQFGSLKGRRIVRGRESECEALYATRPARQTPPAELPVAGAF